MKAKSLILSVFVASVFLVSAPAFAHHGAASYESQKLTTLKGTITDFRFTNPHTEIFFDVTDAAGRVQNWIAEANSVANLVRYGWNKNILKPGDKVSIIGNLAKNGSHTMRLSKLVLPNGKELAIDRGEDYAQ